MGMSGFGGLLQLTYKGPPTLRGGASRLRSEAELRRAMPARCRPGSLGEGEPARRSLGEGGGRRGPVWSRSRHQHPEYYILLRPMSTIRRRKIS